MCLCPVCTERLDFHFPYLDFLICSEGLSVSQWSSCYHVWIKYIKKRTGFTDQPIPLILTFLTFSSSEINFKISFGDFFFQNFLLFGFSTRLHTYSLCFAISFFSMAISHTDNSQRCTSTPATPVVQYLTHNANRWRYIQNSLTLINCISLSPPFFPTCTPTHTHRHVRLFAICMHQYEKSTQARKRKAELDYLGSLWHEKAQR